MSYDNNETNTQDVECNATNNDSSNTSESEMPRIKAELGNDFKLN